MKHNCKTKQKKYSISGKTKIVYDFNAGMHVLKQITAEKRIAGVNPGEPGGWIEKEENLSQEGACWIENDACVYGNVSVCGNAVIKSGACICGKSYVFDNMIIDGNTVIYSQPCETDTSERDRQQKTGSTADEPEKPGNGYMTKKYKITSETKDVYDRNAKKYTVHRIRALKDFSSVSNGEYGGWIESEKNLMQDGECWIHENACVAGNTIISGNSEIMQNCIMINCGTISDNSVVYADNKKNDLVSEILQKNETKNRYRLSVSEYYDKNWIQTPFSIHAPTPDMAFDEIMKITGNFENVRLVKLTDTYTGKHTLFAVSNNLTENGLEDCIMETLSQKNP